MKKRRQWPVTLEEGHFQSGEVAAWEGDENSTPEFKVRYPDRPMAMSPGGLSPNPNLSNCGLRRASRQPEWEGGGAAGGVGCERRL